MLMQSCLVQTEAYILSQTVSVSAAIQLLNARLFDFNRLGYMHSPKPKHFVVLFYQLNQRQSIRNYLFIFKKHRVLLENFRTYEFVRIRYAK